MVLLYAAVVTPLLGILLANLNSIAVYHVMLAWNMERERDELINSVEIINSVISDAERNQLGGDSMKIWVKNLRDVADDAVDFFDEIITYWLRQKMKAGKFFFHLKMGKKLEELRNRLNALVKDKTLLLTEKVPEINLLRPNTSLLASHIHGRDAEREELICDLESGPCSLSTLSIHAICGMGGIGKTTLVQMVFNDPRIADRFNLRMWVSVSQNFDVLRMTSAMLECITEGHCNVLKNLESMQIRLQNELKGKRFLLILDDVWNEDTQKWKPLVSMLNGGATGSTVMMTARDERVACSLRPLYLQESPGESPQKLKVIIHNVKKLHKEDSWKLFKDYAFQNQMQEDDELELVGLGEELEIKCGGIPLAIITLGSIIGHKQGPVFWKSIMESISWDQGESESSIMPILRLSYFHLPPHLRQCFTYCSIFPKAQFFSKEDLIPLWLSCGFIAEENGGDLYGKANEFFLELVQRSFFQGIVDRYGNMKYIMHDLMHDLASSLVPDIYSITDTKRASRIPDKVRHLYFHIPRNHSIANIKIGSLRSLILSSEYDIPAHSISSFIAKAKHLRVLHIGGFRVRDSSSEFTSEEHELVFKNFKVQRIPLLFPKAITKLKHLRYLNMSYSPIEYLPESVGFLLNLQSLVLRYCFRLRKLPNSITNLENLTDFDFRDCYSLTSLPPGIGKLHNLQMLGRYIVAEGTGNGISELSGLNLRGELAIEDLIKVSDTKDVENVNIASKQNLQSLHLSWCKVSEGGTSSEVNKTMETVLDGLCPPKNLKELSLNMYQGYKFADWMRQSHLKHRQLTKITLENIGNCKSLPPLWKIPCLEILFIRRMECVECFFDQDYDETMILFPSLKELVITSMPKFERWTSTDLNNIVFPKLCQLKVTRCPKLKALPSCLMLKMLRIEQSPLIQLTPLSECNSLAGVFLYDFPCKYFPSGKIGDGTKKVIQFLELGKMLDLRSFSPEFECLNNIKHFELFQCPELESLPEGLKNFKALETLSITCLPRLSSFPVGIFPGLSSLRELDVTSCDSLQNLPDDIECLTELRSLRISACKALNTLPTDSLMQLRYLWNLEIFDCERIKEIGSTGWLQYIPSLSRLSITRCFDLTLLLDTVAELKKLDELCLLFPDQEVRCIKENGQDWHKISHVRTIWINNVLIQSEVGISI